MLEQFGNRYDNWFHGAGLYESGEGQREIERLLAMGAAYYAAFHASSTQATLGKMAVGIKVVRTDGTRISVGRGVGSGQQAQPGTLPTIDNSRDWLRQAQRFPVAVEIDPAERAQLRAVQIGGQADVLVYTGDHALMNWLGSVYIRVMSWFAYVY